MLKNDRDMRSKRETVFQWFATPRHNRVGERGIPALPGFLDPERGVGAGLESLAGLREDAGGNSGDGRVKYILELLAARLLCEAAGG